MRSTAVFEDGRIKVWQLLEALWQFSSVDRQRTCRHHPHADFVGIEKRLGRANYTGLVTCGLAWTCPACGPKIALERQADLAAAITAHYSNGGALTMVTQTVPHKRGERLSDTFADLRAGMTAQRRDTVSARLRKALSIGSVTTQEVTLGENGWHPHAHRLDFIRPGCEDQLDQYEEAQRRAYLAAIRKRGLKPSTEHGIDFKRLDLNGAHELVAAYVAKAAAWEMASRTTKQGRRASRNPMQLLADVVANGEQKDLAKWHEYEQATTGRHSLRWSNGLRAALIPELGKELTDQEAAEANDALGRLVALIPSVMWARLRRTMNPGMVLRWAEVYTDDGETLDLLRRKLGPELEAGLSNPPTQRDALSTA